MNLHYQTNNGGSASEVISPTCGVDGDCIEGKEENAKVKRDEIEEAVDEADSQEEEDERGLRRVVKLQDPRKPSEEEVKEHELTHLPFRSWCKHCVAGKSRH